MTKQKIFYIPVLLCVLFVFLVSSLAGCDYVPVYGGEHKNLSFVTLHSIPGTKSNSGDGYIILEQDEFGRILFVASMCGSVLSTESYGFPPVYAVAVMQKSDDAYVYFYGGQNYIYTIPEKFIRLTTETYQQHFSEEEITWVKEVNDWGKPFGHTGKKLIKLPTDNAWKNQIPQSSVDVLEKHFGNKVFAVEFRKDIDGNTSVFVLLVDSYKYEWYMAIFDDEWSLIKNSLTKLNGPDTLQQDVENFMNQQNWKDITE